VSVILRPSQVPAVHKLAAVTRGYLKSPAGSGKTIIGAAAIDRVCSRRNLAPKVLWLAHTLEQCEQALAAIEACDLHYKIRMMCGDAGADIKCYQSGVSSKGYDIVVCDECHHVPAQEFRKIVDGYKGDILWGLTATPPTDPDRLSDMVTLIGPMVYEVPRDELVDQGQLAEGKVYFHAPNDSSEMDVSIEEAAVVGAKKMDWSAKHLAGELSKKSLGEAMRVLGKEQRLELMKIAAGVDRDDDDLISEIKERLSSPKDKETLKKYLLLAAAVEILSRARWHACQSMGVFENQKRNIDIVRLGNNHRMLGDSSIILVGSIEHGKLLAESIPDAVVCYSKMGAKKRRDAIAGFRDGSIKVMIATSLADEGLDVPRANVIIMGAAGRSESKTEQRSGRVMRTFLEKTHGIVHDFWDWQHPLLLNQSRARAKVYFALKYQFETTQVLPTVLKAIGVKFHPSLGMTPAKKPRKKIIVRQSAC
jgi:superfamily II DNA or RNA helicase